MIAKQFAIVNEAPDVALAAKNAQVTLANEAGVVCDGEKGCQVDCGKSRRRLVSGGTLCWSELLYEATLDDSCVEIQPTSLTRSFGTLQ